MDYLDGNILSEFGAALSKLADRMVSEGTDSAQVKGFMPLSRPKPQETPAGKFVREDADRFLYRERSAGDG